MVVDLSGIAIGSGVAQDASDSIKGLARLFANRIADDLSRLFVFSCDASDKDEITGANGLRVGPTLVGGVARQNLFEMRHVYSSFQ